MRKTANIFIIVVAYIGIIGISPATAESGVPDETGTPDEAIQFYRTSIESTILKCEKKAELRTSRSKNIRQASETFCLKARFLKENKPELIRGMVEKNLALKEYKVNYYLDRQFFKDLKKTQLAATY